MDHPCLKDPDHNHGIHRVTYRDKEQWIKDHADHWTTARWLNWKMEKQEHKTLEGAEACARHLLTQNSKPIMIYAVAGSSDAIVKVVK